MSVRDPGASGGGVTIGVTVVTFLVCLVVVGGASILILRVTLEDVFQGATGDLASHGGSPPRSLASRVTAFLAPGSDAASHPDDTDPEPVSATEAAPEPPAAHVQPVPVPVAHATSPEGSPTVETVPASGEGLPRADVVDQPVVWRGEAPTSSVLLEERTTEVPVAGAPEPAPQVAAPPPARNRPSVVASRPPLPPLRRRLLRRAAGAVKLLVLLVVVGSVLALLLGAAAVLFAYAMRAAIGA